MTGLYIFTQALRDNFRPKKVAIWVILGLALIPLGKAWVSINPEMGAADSYIQLSSMLVYRLAALVAAILATGIIGQEVEQKTIVYLLTRPVPRYVLLTARYLAVAISAYLLSALFVVCLSIGIYGPSGITHAQPLKDLVSLLPAQAAYCALFLLISLLFFRSLQICLLYALVWEPAIPNLPGELYRLSVFSYGQAIAQHPQSNTSTALSILSGSAGTNTMSRGTGWAVLILAIGLLTAISCLWFTRFEFVPREDVT